MTHSWKEKLDAAGVRFVEAHAKARQVKPPVSLDFDEIGRMSLKSAPDNEMAWRRTDDTCPAPARCLTGERDDSN